MSLSYYSGDVLLRILPRDEKFYDMFAELAKRLTASATLLHEMFLRPGELDAKVSAIKGLEHEADNLTHDIIDRIDRTFVTPFDREDIHALASELDDVIDLIDGTARRATIFRIQKTRPAAVVLAEVLARAAKVVEEGVTDMKDAKHVYAISEKLKTLEEEGDAVYHDAMGKLFAEGGDALEVIKWKDLYDKIEDALDQCEDVGNVLQSIALKNA
jgi:predicted phosphate transport protein (TIGR00153 family)